MVHRFDIKAVLNSTTKEIFDIKLLPMIIGPDSKLFYHCLVRLGSTQEKQLMVDIIYLRQSYERREIMEIRWIDGNNNFSDTMTKAKLYTAL